MTRLLAMCNFEITLRKISRKNPICKEKREKSDTRKEDTELSGLETPLNDNLVTVGKL